MDPEGIDGLQEVQGSLKLYEEYCAYAHLGGGTLSSDFQRNSRLLKTRVWATLLDALGSDQKYRQEFRRQVISRYRFGIHKQIRSQLKQS